MFTSIPNGGYRVSVHGEGQYRFQAYSSLPTPEHASANFAIGDTVATEDIYAPNDVDVFHFTGAAGDALIGYLTADQPRTGVVHLTITGPGSDNSVLATVGSSGGTPFEYDASPRFVLPAAGVYTVTISAFDPQSEIHNFSGPYKFQIRRIDRNPEHAAVALVPNVAVTGEASTTSATSTSSRWPAPRETSTSSAFRLLTENPRLPAGSPCCPHAQSQQSGCDRVGSEPGDRHRPHRSEHVPISPAGERAHPGPGRRRESAGRPVTASKGSYIIRADHINLAPEVASPFLSVGDSVTSERMDPTGEIDEYTVTVTRTESINFVLRIDSAAYYSHPSPKTTVTADQYTLAGDPRGGTSGACSGRPLIRSSGTFTIDPGQYLMRVSDKLFGITGFASYAGPYTLTINRIDLGPEMRPSVIAIGDTVHDALFPIGDFDNYTFAGVQGDAIEFQIQGLGPLSSPTMLQYALCATNEFTVLASGFVATVTSQLSDNTTGRIVLPATGTYRILIFDGGEGDNPCGQGPYRFALVRLPAIP